jgi:predicted nucleic acid-binding protein
MSVKPFLDTNVIVYALANDPGKKAIAEELLLEDSCISVQVVNEFVSVAVRKLGYSRESAIAAARIVMNQCKVLPLDAEDIRVAFQITERQGFNHWDSLILAVAKRHGCDVVYSEDMQHGQDVAQGMRVINPFVG